MPATCPNGDMLWDVPFTCKFCDSSFDNLDHLRGHEKYHLNMKISGIVPLETKEKRRNRSRTFSSLEKEFQRVTSRLVSEVEVPPSEIIEIGDDDDEEDIIVGERIVLPYGNEEFRAKGNVTIVQMIMNTHPALNAIDTVEISDGGPSEVVSDPPKGNVLNLTIEITSDEENNGTGPSDLDVMIREEIPQNEMTKIPAPRGTIPQSETVQNSQSSLSNNVYLDYFKRSEIRDCDHDHQFLSDGASVLLPDDVEILEVVDGIGVRHDILKETHVAGNRKGSPETLIHMRDRKKESSKKHFWESPKYQPSVTLERLKLTGSYFVMNSSPPKVENLSLRSASSKRGVRKNSSGLSCAKICRTQTSFSDHFFGSKMCKREMHEGESASHEDDDNSRPFMPRTGQNLVCKMTRIKGRQEGVNIGLNHDTRKKIDIGDKRVSSMADLSRVNGESNRHKGTTPKQNQGGKITKSNKLCDMCGKAYVSEFSLKIHRKDHQKDRSRRKNAGPEKRFSDSKVTKPRAKSKARLNPENSDKAYMKNRVKNKTSKQGSKVFECKTCGKRFQSPTWLLKHSRTHIDVGRLPETPTVNIVLDFYHCEQCEKSFDNLVKLRQHESEDHIKINRVSVDDQELGYWHTF